jgi:hypothetical protein
LGGVLPLGEKIYCDVNSTKDIFGKNPRKLPKFSRKKN